MARSRSRVAKLIKKQRVRNRRGGPAVPRSVKTFVALTARLFCLLVFLSAVGFFCFAAYRFAYESDFFELKTLVITGVSGEIATELRALTQLEQNNGINLLRVHSRRVRDTLLNHPKIRSAKVTKRYPNALLIEVEERLPVAVVSTGALFLVDRDGYVLEDVANPNRRHRHLPFITGIDAQTIALGQPIPNRLLTQALDLVECLRNRNQALAAALSEVRIDPDEGLSLILQSGVEVRLGNERFAERLAALELLEKRHGDLEDMQYIDLRFDQQIVYRPRDV